MIYDICLGHSLDTNDAHVLRTSGEIWVQDREQKMGMISRAQVHTHVHNLMTLV
jgi:hypothetical protein